ncbi:hypothetical protein [Synechocystis sp. CACIAM 05]|uniref:hypothetical protein n=1 Tax=Synechocystis sp. CACIAM 05 TaxID=1933929 RepID=UPI00138E7DDE|nr:hypothetical protein [Synechocystis sp. CACIAM 05]QHV00049.1 hypothetical protein BWK47_07850 [Synechocystis sp. CACIAM 05]
MNKININTHLLSPRQKPDSSDYLIHLTDKKGLTNILKSNQLNKGIILAKRDRISFTETPLYGLGFFNRRWPDYKGGKNIKYGIGFTKEFLIKQGAKQAIYLNKKTIKSVKESLLTLASLNKEQRDELATKYGLSINKIEQILDELRETSTDNGEIYSKGGFTWEREWVFNTNNAQGFEFDYEYVALICCPKEEQLYFWKMIKDIYPMKPNPEKSLNFKWIKGMRFIDIDYMYKQTISIFDKLDDYEVNYQKFTHVLTFDSFASLKKVHGIKIATEKIRDIILLSDLKEDNCIDENLLRLIILSTFDNLLVELKENHISSFWENHYKSSLELLSERYTFSNLYELFQLAILDEKNLRFNIIQALVAFHLDYHSFDHPLDCLDTILKEDKINQKGFISKYTIGHDYGKEWQDLFWKYLYDVETVIKENLFDYLINNDFEKE